MARINRFYLLIAAMVMSKTYDASAATKLPWDTCYSIKTCCVPWLQKADAEGINPDDTEIQDPMMQECCESRYSPGSSNYSSCVNVCNDAQSSTLSSTYCNSSSSSGELGEISCDFWDWYQACYDTYAGGGFYYSYPASSQHPDMEYLCPTDSWQYQQEGNLTTDSYCPEGAAIEENVISYCCDNPSQGGYKECMAVVHGDMECSDGSGSGGGDEPSYVPPSCISGQYWDLWGAPGQGANSTAGSCTTCPDYNYATGKYFYNLASSSGRNDDTAAAGSGANVQFCYVPRGNVFTDNSGTFQYVNDCYYYGS